MWLNKAIRMGGINQFGTNTCHHNKKLDQILNHLHLFWDFPKSPINEYSDYLHDLDLLIILPLLHVSYPREVAAERKKSE